MKIIAAFDSFKESMSAFKACDILSQVLKERGIDVIAMPMADGGEGTIAVLKNQLGGEMIKKEVAGPLKGQRINAEFLWIAKSKLAVIEMSEASGLALVAEDKRDPMQSSTYGTGELLRAAIEKGAEAIYLAVGGSATMDLGVGMAQALGFRFVDEYGVALDFIGGNLSLIERIIPPATPLMVPITVLADVDNPLLGDEGAYQVFAKQKGADAKGIEAIFNAWQHFLNLPEVNVSDAPSLGAGGGMAWGAKYFLKAKITSGINMVLNGYDFSEKLKSIDYVVTGEGALNHQSLDGKVLSGLLTFTQPLQIPVVIFTGSNTLTAAQVNAAGIHKVIDIANNKLSLAENLKRGEVHLHQAVSAFAF